MKRHFRSISLAMSMGVIGSLGMPGSVAAERGNGVPIDRWLSSFFTRLSVLSPILKWTALWLAKLSTLREISEVLLGPKLGPKFGHILRPKLGPELGPRLGPELGPRLEPKLALLA